jgi:hypothetical protein
MLLAVLCPNFVPEHTQTMRVKNLFSFSDGLKMKKKNFEGKMNYVDQSMRVQIKLTSFVYRSLPTVLNASVTRSISVVNKICKSEPGCNHGGKESIFRE